MRSHKCTRSREDEWGRKRHIYYQTSVAGGVVRCWGSTKSIHQREAESKVIGGHLRGEGGTQHRYERQLNIGIYEAGERRGGINADEPGQSSANRSDTARIKRRRAGVRQQKTPIFRH